MNNNVYFINDEMLNYISNIMLKIGNINSNFILDEEKNNLLSLLKKVNPSDKDDFKKLQKYRDKNVSSQFAFSHPDASLISSLISNLFKWLDTKNDSIHPLICSSILLYGLVYIHPFDKRNEAIIETWFKLFLTNYNNIFCKVSFPKDMLNNHEFINAVNKTNSSKSLTPFINYILKTIYLSINSNSNKEISDESVKVNKLLSVMAENTPMSAYEIMNKLNIKSKETLRNTYLNIAIEKGLVSLTNPNKKTSRHQMYYKL